jgi:hypothetical protein
MDAFLYTPPPPYPILHNLPNKALAERAFCKIFKTKEIICKILKMHELWLFTRLNDAILGRWIPSLPELIIRDVSREQAGGWAACGSEEDEEPAIGCGVRVGGWEWVGR